MNKVNFVKARFYDYSSGVIRCDVCERRCLLKDGYSGACGNYVNISGVVYHKGYGKLSAVESRPIEIKPLFHYWPGSTALTYSNFGCNFYCPWCQNDHLSFRKPSGEEEYIPPEKLVEIAILHGDDGLSASFNEPITNLDYVLDVTELAVKKGLYSMMVTNMYFTERSLKASINAGVDGFSADIKGCPQMKKALLGVDHGLVFRNAKLAVDLGAHVEIVYLVVTNTNDFEECFEWIIDNHLKYLGSDVPLHINRYYPAHRWSEPPTPIEKLLAIRDYAMKQGLKYVYVGNVGDPELESTRCPRCRRTVIYRRNFRVLKFNLDFTEGKYKCRSCGEVIHIRGRYISGKDQYFRTFM
ncbi:MAG: radical SAM protein [Desulfurococcaceae archaeon]